MRTEQDKHEEHERILAIMDKCLDKVYKDTCEALEEAHEAGDEAAAIAGLIMLSDKDTEEVRAECIKVVERSYKDAFKKVFIEATEATDEEAEEAAEETLKAALEEERQRNYEDE